MQITFEIPDEMASVLQARGQDLSRTALEAVGIEAYRQHLSTGDQLRRMLGLGTRYEMDGFLKQHEVWLEYSIEDFERDGETAERLWQERRDVRTDAFLAHG
jgi:hypothetical protein